MLHLFSIFAILLLYSTEVFSAANRNLHEKVMYQLEDIDTLFKDFMMKFGKKYNDGEINYRRKVFEDNLVKINSWNRDRDAVYGINKFTDLTFDEFAKTHTCFFGNVTNENAIKYKPTGTAPDSLDWRQQNLVTEVKDQGGCGSCYIFGAIGNIEGQYAKSHRQLVSLSEQQCLDCNAPNGCNGGFPHEVMQSLAGSGVMSESDYPYEGVQDQCRADQNKKVVKVTDGNLLSVASEDDLKDALAQYGPLAIGLYFNEKFKHYNGGVSKPANCNGNNNHALLLVGYGTDGGEPFWLIKNSWGPTWGENGYLRLIRGQGACNIGSYAASATVA